MRLEFLTKIDRRIVYFLVFVSVAIPLLLKPRVTIEVSEPVKKAFNTVENLPPGSTILVSTDYGPGTMPEVNPMVKAFLRHALRKGHKIILVAVVDALGLALGDQVLREVASELGKKYGIDYVNLGFKPGMEAVIVSMGKNIRDIFPVDVNGIPLDSLPITKDIHSLKDIALIADFASGSGLQAWINFAQARFGATLIGGVTAVMGPENYPFLNSGQLKGLIAGLKGAAEYETLIKKPELATSGMPAQTALHLLVIVLIVLGNIGYILGRRK